MIDESKKKVVVCHHVHESCHTARQTPHKSLWKTYSTT